MNLESNTFTYTGDAQQYYTVNGGSTDFTSFKFTEATLKFKLTHPDAKLPTKNHADDTGFDVYSVETKTIPARGSAVVDVGLEFADITPGYWVKVEGRSGLGFKHNIVPHAGIIDSGYRGNAGILLRNLSDNDYQVNAGDRIAQFVVYRNYSVTITEATETAESDRGAQGFGSSGQ
jgi:dUTP pyrophosphatase